MITLFGVTSIRIGQGSTYEDQGAAAYDNNDGDITNNIVVDGFVDTSQAGTYSISYNVSDSNGNAADEVTRTVYVVDTTPPVLKLIGESTKSIIQGSVYSDLGASAEDNINGDISSSIVVGGLDTLNTNILGDYIITYDVSDVHGNIAAQVLRTVNVRTTIVESYTNFFNGVNDCLLYTSPSPRDREKSRMPSSA